MGRFKNSWDITKTTFSVMHKEKELFAYPFISSGLSILLFLVLFVPLVFSLTTGSEAAQYITYILFLIILYVGVFLIKTFFDVATSYTAAQAFAGQPATMKNSMKFCFSRFFTIFKWALLAATVGIALKALESLGRQKGAGAIVASIVQSILGLAWKISTLFVIPVIVYENANPFAAIKSSVEILKKTWGEALIKWASIGLINMVASFLVVLFLIIPAIFFLFTGALTLGLILIGLGILILIAVSLTFSIADDVFNTALYVYAKTGTVPTGYTQEQIDAAFKLQ